VRGHRIEQAEHGLAGWERLIGGGIDLVLLEKKRLHDREREQLQGLATVEAAGEAVEAGAFDPSCLDELIGRDDPLGRLARVFQRMARDFRAREELLRQEVECLRIEIDEAKRQREVHEVVEMDYFQHLQERARQLRAHR